MKSGKRLNEEFVVPAVTHGGRSIMVWGCFQEDRTGGIIQVKGIMKNEQYCLILQMHAISSGMHNWKRNQPSTSQRYKALSKIRQVEKSNNILEIITCHPHPPQTLDYLINIG